VPDPTPTPVAKSRVAGYAAGATTVTREGLLAAIKRLLGEATPVSETAKGVTTTRVTHETDHPTTFRAGRRVKTPSALPVLDERTEAPSGALEHEATVFLGEGTDLDVVLHHQAFALVAATRRHVRDRLAVLAVTPVAGGVSVSWACWNAAQV
jgi:hypothetical protein